MPPARRCHGLYRILLRLYPRSFRSRYGDDLVLHFADLVADRGARAAWARTAVDLVVTVPRYRLEAVMSDQHSSRAIAVLIGLLVAGAIASVLTGVGSPLLLLLAACGLALAERTALARSIRMLDPDRRRHRFVVAATSAAVFVVCYAVFEMVVGDTWTVRETVLTIIGMAALFCAVGFLIAGLLTPRTGRRVAAAEAQ